MSEPILKVQARVSKATVDVNKIADDLKEISATLKRNKVPLISFNIDTNETRLNFQKQLNEIISKIKLQPIKIETLISNIDSTSINTPKSSQRSKTSSAEIDNIEKLIAAEKQLQKAHVNTENQAQKARKAEEKLNFSRNDNIDTAKKKLNDFVKFQQNLKPSAIDQSFGGVTKKQVESLLNKAAVDGTTKSIKEATHAMKQYTNAQVQAGNTGKNVFTMLDNKIRSFAAYTAGNEVVQDPNVVGTMLKTAALRLTNTKGELEELGEDAEGAAESITKLQTQLLNLTKGKVDIMLNPDTFKSTYDIMLAMSEVFDEMSQKDQMTSLELIFGKKGANVGASIIQNMETAQTVVETALQSAGSALQENEVHLSSIQGKTERLKASMVDFWNNFINSDMIKFGTDAANTIVNIAATFDSLKNVGKRPVLLQKLRFHFNKCCLTTSCGTCPLCYTNGEYSGVLK